MDANEARQQPVRLLGWDDLRAKGIKNSKPTIYRKIKAGDFRARSTQANAPAWPEHEVDAHLLSLIAQRDRGARNGDNP